MFLIFESFLITFIAYLIAKRLSHYLSRVPVLVIGMFCVIGMLSLVQLPYEQYMQGTHELFGRLLGYVTVALAIPLATMRYDDLPLKKLSGILCFASTSAVLLPVSLAYLLHMAHPTVLAFTTRAVTTPIAINIANLVGSPVSLVILIVILSGLIGASFSSLILRNIHDERASGLALGLAAHAIGTVQAWQRGPVAGRYAAFGMAVNGVFTAIWLPLVLHLLRS